MLSILSPWQHSTCPHSPAPTPLPALTSGREESTALDAACGPGSLTQRILDTCPRARVIALDTDPVQPAIGSAALMQYGDRLRWLDADLRDPSWPEPDRRTPGGRNGSTTALH
ncbi:class I SAM-dependent methyltransferase [Streptomyces malaysiensis]